MKRTAILVAAGVLVVALAGWAVTRARAKGDGDGVPPARNQVDLTIYPQDFAMVSEVRPLSFAAGHNRLPVIEVSRELDPQSVILSWQTTGQTAPRLISHAYDLGVSDRAGLLRRYLGRQVEVVRYGDNGREAERQAGTLMAASDGNLVLRSDGRFFVNPPGTIVAPSRPDVVTIPQLSVEADSPAAQKAGLQLGYLTRGLSWSADYVATLNPKADTLDLECWATVTNRTGVDFPAARVTLVAGSPNRAAVEASRRGSLEAQARDLNFAEGHAKLMQEAPAAMGGPGPARASAPEAVGEAQTFKIDSPTSIVQEQMNRLLMFGAGAVPAPRDYSARPPTLSVWDDWYAWGTPDRPRRGPVGVSLSFLNKPESHLGMPLPAGALRLYEPDASGALRYVGAAGVADTPKGARVDVTLASAFDVYTEYAVARRQRVDRRTTRKHIEVILHNDKSGPVTVRVVQPFYGSWRVVSESHTHKKLDAQQAQWAVPVPAGSATTLKYSVLLTG